MTSPSPNQSPRTPPDKSSTGAVTGAVTPGITPEGIRVLYERLMQKHLSFLEESRVLLRRQFEADVNNCANLKNMMGMDPPLHEHLFLLNEEANKLSEAIHTPVTTTKKRLSMTSPKGSAKKNKNEKCINDKEKKSSGIKSEPTEIKMEATEMTKEETTWIKKEPSSIF